MTTQVVFPVLFRPLEDDDVGFVAKSWQMSFHGGNRDIGRIPFHRYKREQRAVIRDCLERGKCVIACDPKAPSNIYGFACGWDDIGVGVLHYVYVIQTRRKMGLGAALVHEIGTACGRTMKVYTHRTRATDYSLSGAGMSFTGKLGLSFDPFSLVRLIYASDGTVRSRAGEVGEARQPTDAAHPGGPSGGSGTSDAA